MSLTGHLDVFPLEEVLRLLSRSYKTGCLRVDTPEQHGRIFLDSGSLTFATVGSDDDFRRQLAQSGLVTDEGLRGVEIGGRSLTEVVGADSGSHELTDLLREEVIESLYRIRRPGRGQFVFNIDVYPRYRADQSFDVELCVAEADRRAADWADTELVISSVDVPLVLQGDAPHGEPVTLAPNTWRMVAAFEGAASVRSLADRLGVSQFRVAKDLAGLVRAGLVASVESQTPPVSEPVIPAPAYPSAVTAEPPTAYPWSVPVQEPVEAQHDRSWWQEPVVPGGQAPAPVSSEEAEPVADEETAAVEPTLSDAFLDRVFSQLEEDSEASNPPTDTEQAPVGHGFLKRRRMSSIGLDDV
ncbi:MAG TPA: DUF4388 domain-containing protein [Acidimicrobiia bacterium]|nr:DUF4388 domain-containing protein [Acidimicrobiia bacterium]